MTTNKKWDAISAIGWGTRTTDYDNIELTLLFSEDQIKEFEDFCYTQVEQVHRALHKNWQSGHLHGQPWLGDDSFHDLCCHIVGMGRQVFEEAIATAQPPYAVEAAENFMYIFHKYQPQ